MSASGEIKSVSYCLLDMNKLNLVKISSYPPDLFLVNAVDHQGPPSLSPAWYSLCIDVTTLGQLKSRNMRVCKQGEPLGCTLSHHGHSTHHAPITHRISAAPDTRVVHRSLDDWNRTGSRVACCLLLAVKESGSGEKSSRGARSVLYSSEFETSSI